MNFDELLTFSNNWAPPIVDVREAEIRDSYGDTEWAQLVVSHEKADDVKLSDFEYYTPSVFSFMEDTDLLFYMYSVFKFYYFDHEFEHIDCFLYSLNDKVVKFEKLFSPEQKTVFIKYCKLIFKKHLYHADWVQSKTLSKYCNIDNSRESESKWLHETFPKP